MLWNHFTTNRPRPPTRAAPIPKPFRSQGWSYFSRLVDYPVNEAEGYVYKPGKIGPLPTGGVYYQCDDSALIGILPGDGKGANRVLCLEDSLGQKVSIR